MERLIDPVIADLQAEHKAALRTSSAWRSRWVLLVGYVAFAKVVLICGLLGTQHAWLNWSIDDQRGLSRTLLWVAIVTAVLTIVLGMPSFLQTFDMREINANARPERLILYLIPSSLALSLPAGLAIGAVLGLSRSAKSRRMLGALGLLAVVMSFASLVNVSWITPLANQSYRVEVVGNSIAVGRGRNELSLSELRATPGGTFLYQSRLALAIAPLTFAIFGIVIGTRRWRRTVGVFMACAGVVSYIFALNFGMYFNYHEMMPARVAAWTPHILLACATILIARLVSGTVTRTRA
jgi:lipopolysaccharide export LptBFGC system permease protein LptF